MRKIKLSIVIPIYNSEKWLEQCLESIHIQSFEEFEVLMIDDGSTDNSKSICKLYEKKDDRFKLVSIENSGSAHARNVGIDLASGEYIGFVDSDDYIEKDMYEKLMLVALQNKVDVIIGGVRYIDESGKVVIAKKMNVRFNKILSKNDIKEQLIYPYYTNDMYGIPALWNKVYRLDLIRNYNLKIDEQRIKAEDYWFNMDIFRVANTVIVIPDIIYNYIQHSNSVMHQFRKNQFEMCCQTRKRLLELNQEFEFDINYNKFDIGFIQETTSYILMMVKNDKKSSLQCVKQIITSDIYIDALDKCSELPWKLKIASFLTRKKKYLTVYVFYRLWASIL